MLEKSYYTLVLAGSHRNLRLVLDTAFQETYSIKDKSNFQLLADLERKVPSQQRYTMQRSNSSMAARLGKESLRTLRMTLMLRITPTKNALIQEAREEIALEEHIS